MRERGKQFLVRILRNNLDCKYYTEADKRKYCHYQQPYTNLFPIVDHWSLYMLILICFHFLFKNKSRFLLSVNAHTGAILLTIAFVAFIRSCGTSLVSLTCAKFHLQSVVAEKKEPQKYSNLQQEEFLTFKQGLLGFLASSITSVSFV